MISLLKSIVEMFQVKLPEQLVMHDPTVYRIETASRKYCGQIIYQDDVIIKLKVAKPKQVKILKANIDRITIVQTEMAKQYYQLKNFRLQA